MFSKDREAGLAWEGWPGGGGWGVGEGVWYAGILGLCGLGRRVRVPLVTEVTESSSVSGESD